MKIEGIVNINGTNYSPLDAKISVFDRGFLFGDSVYEVTRSYEGKLLFLEDHLERLWNSAEFLSIEINISKSEFRNRILMIFNQFNEPNAYLRLVVTRGEGRIGLDPKNSSSPNILVYINKHQENPQSWYEQGVQYIIAKTVRNHIKALNPNVKSGNYLNNILAFIEAKQSRAFDAIMLNNLGQVTEGTTNNIWIIKSNRIITPPLEVGILKGITRTMLLEACREHELNVFEEIIYPDDIYAADECFITSSTKELVPVVKVDEFIIGNGLPGELTKKLHKLYKQKINDYLR